jgi:ElaB/YqjD/DUF883 family membrane-anchored ribosome-binding protein
MKNNDAAKASGDLMNDIGTIVSDAESLAAGSISDRSAAAMSNLRDRFEVAQRRFGEVYDGAKQKVVAGAKSTDTAIRENPYQSLAIALGVGVLIGALIGRRTK